MTPDQTIDNSWMLNTEFFLRFAEKAMGWVSQNAEAFDPFTKPQNSPDETRLKAICELLFLGVHMMRLQTPWSRQVSTLSKFLLQCFNSNAFLYESSTHRPPLIGSIALCNLSELSGLDPDRPRRLIESRLLTHYFWEGDMAPFRRMDMCYCLRSAGVNYLHPDLQELYRSTLLAQKPFLPGLELPDMYAITHTVFYLTDMIGLSSGELSVALPVEELNRIRKIARVLLGMCLRSANLDILGELLLCAAQLEDTPTYAMNMAWQRIAAAQHESGFVPGPEFSYKALAQLASEDEKRSYIFEKNYHTTLVCLMTATLWYRQALNNQGMDQPVQK
jgi:hypothetical protein